jgi:hypothetical protein
MKSIACFSTPVRRAALLLLAFSTLAISAAEVKADLSRQQARKLISKMAGVELPGSSVRIKSISAAGATSAEATAEIKTVFRFEKDNSGQWRVREVRTGQDRWLQISHLANALNTKLSGSDCSAPDPPFRGSKAVDPSIKRARCLLANLLGIDLPSDSVRVQEVSPLGIPLASQPSAIVIALITLETRFSGDGGKGWRLTDVRSGKSDWVNVEALADSLDTEKREQARGELEWIAEALEKLRKDTGFYVVSDSHAVAMDHLSPKYLPRVIRFDPWQHPYTYQGERAQFKLRSFGRDGKDGTADDIELVRPVH